MRRCAFRRVHRAAFCPARAAPRPCPGVIRHLRTKRGYASLRTVGEDKPEVPLGSPHNYAVFDKITHPEDHQDIDAWITLLEQALPLHLRERPDSSSSVVLNAVDVAEILLAAQYPNSTLARHSAVDLLYQLGIERGRWSATVWLIKKLVEHFPVPHQRSNPLTNLTNLWDQFPSLGAATAKPINFDLETIRQQPASIETRSLIDLTSARVDALSRQDLLKRDALGQVWRSLGAMTLSCSDGLIRPEVLEILSYLHHKEFMPPAVYQYTPNPDKTAVQQPPFIPLLSSRIMTSLSDAAWRAHEKIVVDEAKARGADYAALRPEVPGTAYRVHVAGLKVEVWMELILWSCLHGGWILQGAEILHSIHRQGTEERGGQWKPMSWRKFEEKITPSFEVPKGEWNHWDYLFRTTASSARDEAKIPAIHVERTVSSEVVNAYIESLVSSVNVGVGDRGSNTYTLLAQLSAFGRFLQRSSLSISTGSWDALAMRLVDSSHENIIEIDAFLGVCVNLSPSMRKKLRANNLHDLPAYVLDGSAATQGLLHRALHHRSESGNIESALHVFRGLQTRVDTERQDSLEDFFTRSKSLPHPLSKEGMFTSNFRGIDYPTLNLQIPTATLGAFFGLVIENKMYDFALWLIYATDVDGPVIPPSLYGDQFIQPALFRFAAETGDRALLTQLRELKLSQNTYRSILDTQITTRNWTTAVRVLEHLQERRGATWSVSNLAALARAVLRLQSQAHTNEKARDLVRANGIFTAMLRGKYSSRFTLAQHLRVSVRNLLTVLAAVNADWAKLCAGLLPVSKYEQFVLKVRPFNIVLEGVVAAHGSAAGRRLLGIFWPHSARGRERASLPRVRPTKLDERASIRIAIPVPGEASQEARELVVYGAITPNVATILIVFEKALEEIQQTSYEKVALPDDDQVDLSPRGMVIWSVKRLLEMRVDVGTIIQQLDLALEGKGLEDVRAELSLLTAQAEKELVGRDQDPDEYLDFEEPILVDAETTTSQPGP